jgi:hypothetical protein
MTQPVDAPQDLGHSAGKKLEDLGRWSSGTHVELQYRILSGFVRDYLWASRTGAKASSETVARERPYVGAFGLRMLPTGKAVHTAKRAVPGSIAAR